MLYLYNIPDNADLDDSGDSGFACDLYGSYHILLHKAKVLRTIGKQLAYSVHARDFFPNHLM